MKALDQKKKTSEYKKFMIAYITTEQLKYYSAYLTKKEVIDFR